MKELIEDVLSFFNSLFPKKLCKEDKKSLMSFTQNYFLGNSLGDNEAQTNIELGLVELIYSDGRHCANGLLITKNGFMVINDHCLDVIMECKIKTDDGKIYDPINILHKNEDKDVALIKIDLKGPQEPMIYKFFDHRRFPDYRTEIFHLSRWNGEIKYTRGMTHGSMGDIVVGNEEPRVLRSLLMFQSMMRKGDSGGPLVTKEREFIGILSAASSGVINRGSCSVLFDILEMISDYCYDKS